MNQGQMQMNHMGQPGAPPPPQGFGGAPPPPQGPPGAPPPPPPPPGGMNGSSTDNLVAALTGGGDGGKLRGQYSDFAVLDEVAMMPPNFWTMVVRPMLADRKGGAWFIY